MVDEDDRVVARRPRSEVHRQKLRHRAVHVFLFRSDGRLLIHHRPADKEEFPSVWTSSCSGHVAAGESYADAAQRELDEELGVHTLPQPLWKFPASAATSQEFTVLYRATWDGDIVPDSREITDVRWINLQELTAWIDRASGDFSPAFVVLFRWLSASR